VTYFHEEQKPSPDHLAVPVLLRAYDVSEDEGVLVEMDGGSRLMIGSQRPKELENAIARAKQELEGWFG